MAAGKVVNIPCCPTAIAPSLFYGNRLQLVIPPGRNFSCCFGEAHTFESLEDDGGILSRKHIKGGWRHHFPLASESVDEGASTSVQDWRTFRAQLCKVNSQRTDLVSVTSIEQADERWAHEIGMPEVGCILLATQKLDKHPLLGKSVVLLVNSDRGSFRGVMLNRKLPFALELVNHVDMGVILGLKACPVFLGGPISSASTFHLVSPHFLPGLKSVLPGLRVGEDQVALLSCWDSIKRNQVANTDVRVHIGELEWDLRILETEIKVFEWWRTVSCSSSVLLKGDVEYLWESIDSLLSMR